MTMLRLPPHRLPSGLRGLPLIARAAIIGPLWDSKGGTLLSILGIALGVALGVAVGVINRSAVDEFARAVKSLSGEADLVVKGPRGGFDEAVYPMLARLPEVAVASPAVDVNVSVAGRPGALGALRVLGLDPFRAARLLPWMRGSDTAGRLAVQEPDAVLLSAAAADWLGLELDDVLQLQVGQSAVTLKVIGVLPAERYPQRLALMDIAGAQWRLDMLGRISRVDLRLRPGADVQDVIRTLRDRLPAGVQLVAPEAEVAQSANLSRAYRVNLNVLALVALFTGAFLVFSTQALGVLRRRGLLALARVMGVTRRGLVGLLLAEGALIGLAGAALGIALGYGLAVLGLGVLGGDLGAGYFRGLAPVPGVSIGTLLLFLLLGLAAALTGSLAPALETAAAPPAQALKAGDQEQALGRTRRLRPGLLLVAAGLVAAQGPPLSGLPLLAYLAIGLILVGTILLMPVLAAACFAVLPRPRGAAAQIAVAQLQGSPGLAAISMAAILVSFSLMVAMLIMIASFRQSVDDWLTRLLPADLYLRAAAGGESAFFGTAEQALIGGVPGVERAAFQRLRTVLLSPEHPPVTLIARSLDPGRPEVALPLVARAPVPSGGSDLPPVWISEAVGDLHGIRAGQTLRLPMEGRTVEVRVAGVWRDYARQTGAIVIPRDRYIALTGDRRADDAALWLAPQASADAVTDAVRARVPQGGWLDIARSAEIRAASLRIFDQSFAVTYLLEAVAIVIGLFGVGSSFSAQVVSRRREFGMLRHIGMSRREIVAMLGLEGAILGGLGVAVGLGVGWINSLILIRVVNRQSFHWSMDLHLDPAALLGLALFVVLAATLTAAWSGHRAMTEDVIRAVREDW